MPSTHPASSAKMIRASGTEVYDQYLVAFYDLYIVL